ncbi:hypothetical protein [Pedobacter endophyticus]|uniref:CarboxypepD_reg-like domain-containing protein n=1 Tax=Pedobacter endophyticus TaxID=2789740 RepID=A0A7U3SPU7_9SPHI|nr:hypothetical protein [Pedobacter endophyticus]QPH38436.1 hypothetical protein IZT61_15270 [Pedobacter endophyticus]
MKTLLLFALIALSCNVCAQQINGQVFDMSTKLPLAHVVISYGLRNTFTAADGTFKLGVVGTLGSVKIHKLGYQDDELSLLTIFPNVKIYLRPTSITLDDITIVSKRDYLADSLKMRKEYANIFDYKAPTIKDVLVKKGLRRKQPGSNLVSNSTSSIISFDVLKTIGLLTKDKSSISKLQKVQLKDEESNYINRRFNAKKIVDITGLANDSLQIFVDRYLPTAVEVKKMSDYQLLMYIKRSYAEFVKPNKR